MAHITNLERECLLLNDQAGEWTLEILKLFFYDCANSYILHFLTTRFSPFSLQTSWHDWPALPMRTCIAACGGHVVVSLQKSWWRICRWSRCSIPCSVYSYGRYGSTCDTEIHSFITELLCFLILNLVTSNQIFWNCLILYVHYYGYTMIIILLIHVFIHLYFAGVELFQSPHNGSL